VVIFFKRSGKASCADIDYNEPAGKIVLEYPERIERMESPQPAISKIKKPVIAQTGLK
jgi:hypothetical protein